MTSSLPERSVWIVRHGLRVDFTNPEWVSSAENPYNPPLDPIGLKQAEDTAERLKPETIDHIFSSPFLRTLQTATVIAEMLQKKINVEPGFSEWLTRRSFEHKPVLSGVMDLYEEFPSIDTDYRSTINPDYPEDQQALDARTGTALLRIMNEYAGNLLIVSHGSPIHSIHRALTGVSPSAFQPMASVTRFDGAPGVWRLVINGDSSHITAPRVISG